MTFSEKNITNAVFVECGFVFIAGACTIDKCLCINGVTDNSQQCACGHPGYSHYSTPTACPCQSFYAEESVSCDCGHLRVFHKPGRQEITRQSYSIDSSPNFNRRRSTSPMHEYAAKSQQSSPEKSSRTSTSIVRKSRGSAFKDREFSSNSRQEPLRRVSNESGRSSRLSHLLPPSELNSLDASAPSNRREKRKSYKADTTDESDRELDEKRRSKLASVSEINEPAITTSSLKHLRKHMSHSTQSIIDTYLHHLKVPRHIKKVDDFKPFANKICSKENLLEYLQSTTNIEIPYSSFEERMRVYNVLFKHLDYPIMTQNEIRDLFNEFQNTNFFLQKTGIKKVVFDASNGTKNGSIDISSDMESYSESEKIEIVKPEFKKPVLMKRSKIVVMHVENESSDLESGDGSEPLIHENGLAQELQKDEAGSEVEFPIALSKNMDAMVEEKTVDIFEMDIIPSLDQIIEEELVVNIIEVVDVLPIKELPIPSMEGSNEEITEEGIITLEENIESHVNSELSGEIVIPKEQYLITLKASRKAVSDEEYEDEAGNGEVHASSVIDEWIEK